jgi:signal transduction histidine kinase
MEAAKMSFLQSFFDVSNLAPHGLCLLWRPELIWLHVTSDAIIALSYYSIPVVIAMFVWKRPDVGFGWVFWSFAVFILACGTTHVFGIWTLWVPDYAAEGGVKALTAAASVATAIGLWPLLPQALALPSPHQLRQANEALQVQIAERDSALAALQREKEERQKAEDMLRQAQKMEAIGQLTAGIAHDFNNLMTVVIGNVERAKRRVLQHHDVQVQKALEGAQIGAERAAVLTNRLLAFGRRQPLVAKTICVNDLLEHLADMLDRTLGDDIRVVANLTAGLGLTTIDAEAFENAIINLAVNARDAMAGTGALVLSTRNVPASDPSIAAFGLSTGDHVEIAVSDTGAGMSPQVASHAFEPFFTTKSVGQGSGLGLSQVYGFAVQSGGTAVIDCTSGSGTMIRLFLPQAAADRTGDELSADPAALVPKEAAR